MTGFQQEVCAKVVTRSNPSHPIPLMGEETAEEFLELVPAHGVNRPRRHSMKRPIPPDAGSKRKHDHENDQSGRCEKRRNKRHDYRRDDVDDMCSPLGGPRCQRVNALGKISQRAPLVLPSDA